MTYTVSDGVGGTDASTLRLTVTAADDAPVDGDEANTVTEDTTLVVAEDSPANLLSNATDVDGDRLAVTGFTVAGQTLAAGQTATIPDVGALTINADGSYTFAPAANHTGAIPPVTYTVSDGTLTDTSTLTLTITPVNDAPVDANETISTAEDTPATGNVLAIKTDVDGDPLTVTGFTVDGQTLAAGQTATIAGVGTLRINGEGAYTFTPASDYNGAPPVATYTVSDGTLTDTSTLTITVTPVNDAPVDANETITTAEDTPATGNVLDNASDVDADTLTVTGFTVAGVGTFTAGQTATIPNVGTLTIAATGDYTFTPAPNYDGPVPVATYTVSDGTLTDTSTLTISITPVNDAPVDANETVSTLEDTPATGNVLENPTDVDGDPLTVTGFTVNGQTLAAGQTATITGVGTLRINGDGSYTFTPTADYHGTPPVATYTVSDGTLTDTSTLTITVTPVNDAPVDANETVTTAEDTPATGNVLANASDVDNPALSVTSFTVNGQTLTAGQTATIPNVGTLRINGDGAYTFTPASNYSGAPPIATYTVSDGTLTDTSTLTIAVTPVNDAPVDGDEIVTPLEDTPATGNVLDNASDPDGTPAVTQFTVNGQTLTAGQTATIPGVGTLKIDGDGAYVFTPVANYNGTVPVATYTVSDGTLTDTSTLTITVTPVADAPTIGGTNDLAPGVDNSVEESDLPGGSTPAGNGEISSGTFTISAPDGLQSLTVGNQVISAGQLAASGATPIMITTPNGQIVINGYDPTTGAVSYTFTLGNAVDQSGGPVIEQIALVVTDAQNDTTSGVLGVRILDDRPLAVNDLDEAINRPNNPSSVATGNVVTGVDPGTDPNTTDGQADRIGADGANSAPVTGVVAGTGSTAGSGGNLGAPVAGAYGELTLNADGSYSYQPDFANPVVSGLAPQATLTDTFTYEIRDANGDIATATLTIAIFGTPAITGLGDGATAGTDGSVLEQDLADGTNAAGPGETLNGSFGAIARPDVPLQAIEVGGVTLTLAELQDANTFPVDIVTAKGTLSITGFNQATGVVSYSYTLSGNVDHAGGAQTDDFAVAIIDEQNNRGDAVLSIAIVDDAPQAVDDVATANEDGAPTTGSVTLNDEIGADQSGSPVTGVVAGAGAPVGGVGTPVVGQYGSLTLNADGTYSYTVDNADPAVDALAPGDTLTEVYTYQITDSDGDVSTATLTITINGANDAPADLDEIVSTPEDGGPLTGNVLTNASDVDGAPLSVTSFTVAGLNGGAPITAGVPALIPAVGTLVVNPDGSYTFSPVADFNGPAPVVTYTVSDGTLTNTSTLNITVTSVNDAPVDANDTNTVTEDTPLVVQDGAAGDLLLNADDIDGDPLAITQFQVQGVAGTFTAGQTATIPNVGALTINADGSYTFAPFADRSGPVPVVTYTVSDGALTDTSTLTLTITPVNDAPVDGDETVTTREDTPATGNVLANASDVDSPAPALTVTQFTVTGVGTFTAGQTATIPDVGTLTIAADGAYTFTPAANYDGPVPITTYTVSDGAGGTDASTLSFTITPVNDAPVDGPETNSTAEDTPLVVANGAVGDLLNNASDSEGSQLTITRFTVANVAGAFTAGQTATITNVGALTINADGSYTFTPVANYDGPVPVATYTVSDGALTDTSTLTITLTPVNDAPIDGDETVTTLEDMSATGSVLANASDADNPTSALTVTSYTVNGQTLTAGDPAVIANVGTFVINTDGSYTFTPVADYVGPPLVVTYTVSDGTLTDTSTLAIAVTPVNDAPVDGDEINTVTEDTPLVVLDGSAGDLLANASDVDGGPLTITRFTIDGFAGTFIAGQTATIPGVGALTINANGSYSFTPSADYDGAVPVVTYTVSDGSQTDTSTLNLTMTPVNDTPVDGSETVSTPEDTTATGNVLENPTDVDGDVLSVTQFTVNNVTFTAGQTATIANVGTLKIDANGAYTFTPAANSNGQVPVVTYTVSDGVGGTDASTLRLTVTAADDAPVDGDEANTVTEDTTLVVAEDSPANLLSNATDVDGDRLAVTGFTVAGQTLAAGQTATIPDVGALTINADGSYTFAPAANHTGAIPPVTYTVSDGTLTDTSTLTLTITPVNDAPVDANETISTAEDTPATGNVLAIKTDVDGDPLTVTGFTVDGQTLAAGQTATIAGVGTLRINGDGSYTFTPTADYNGTPPVATYTVSDGTLTDTSTLTITVTPVNDAPVDANETVTTPEDTPATGNVLANASDVDNPALSVTSFTVNGQTLTAGQTATIPNVGTLRINGDGAYTFTPASNYSGAPPIATYTVSDGTLTDTSTLAISITPVNDAPVDANETVSTLEDTPTTGNVLENPTDVDGEQLTVTGFSVDGQALAAGQTATIAGVGTLKIDGDGAYVFTPVANYNGTVPVATYTVSDGTLTDTSTLTITVTPVNGAPVDDNETVSSPEDMPARGNVLDNASDADGDKLRVSGFEIGGRVYEPGDVATIRNVGTITIKADGSYVFRPVDDYSGPVPKVIYTVSDGDGGTATSTLKIEVAQVNDAPVDGGETVSTREDAPATGNVLDNARDPDGDRLTVSNFEIGGRTYAPGDVATIAGVGTLTINANGSYSFNPARDYAGEVPVATYTVTDGNGGTNISTLRIEIEAVDDGPDTIDDTDKGTVNQPVRGDVLANDDDGLTVKRFVIDGQRYSAGETATIPGVGTLMIAADGSYLFMPVKDYVGDVPVANYVVADAQGRTTTATLSIEIVAEPPVEDVYVPAWYGEDGEQDIAPREHDPFRLMTYGVDDLRLVPNVLEYANAHYGIGFSLAGAAPRYTTQLGNPEALEGAGVVDTLLEGRGGYRSEPAIMLPDGRIAEDVVDPSMPETGDPSNAPKQDATAPKSEDQPDEDGEKPAPVPETTPRRDSMRSPEFGSQPPDVRMAVAAGVDWPFEVAAFGPLVDHRPSDGLTTKLKQAGDAFARRQELLHDAFGRLESHG